MEPRRPRTHLEGLQEGVEVDEDDLGDLVLAGVDEEQHVGDPQEGQQDQRGLHSFPGSTGARHDGSANPGAS